MTFLRAQIVRFELSVVKILYTVPNAIKFTRLSKMSQLCFLMALYPKYSIKQNCLHVHPMTPGFIVSSCNHSLMTRLFWMLGLGM